MAHHVAPKGSQEGANSNHHRMIDILQILAMDDGTFPVLLKTLSDSSEVVVKHDLQLLAQISSSSEEGYFRLFMANLLELFSTDRRLLDTRGSLIVRQLCVSLGAERIYRTFSEILEKDEVQCVANYVKAD